MSTNATFEAKLMENVDLVALIRRMVGNASQKAGKLTIKCTNFGGPNVKYMLLIYHSEQEWEKLTEAEREGIYREYRQLTQQTQSSGHYLTGSQLQPTASAISVRVRDGKQVVTDGPFAETREQLGGYILIEARDLEEAKSIAGLIPSARVGTVEVRALAESAAPATA